MNRTKPHKIPQAEKTEEKPVEESVDVVEVEEKRNKIKSNKATKQRGDRVTAIALCFGSYK